MKKMFKCFRSSNKNAYVLDCRTLHCYVNLFFFVLYGLGHRRKSGNARRKSVFEHLVEYVSYILRFQKLLVTLDLRSQTFLRLFPYTFGWI